MKITIEITSEELMQLGLTDVNKNDNEAALSIHFKEWADSFFILGTYPEHEKEKLLSSCRNSFKSLKDISTSSFKKDLRLWCEISNYTYEDRIMKNVKISINETKTVEFIRVTKK